MLRLDPDSLQVGFEHPFGPVICMADIIASDLLLPANIT